MRKKAQRLLKVIGSAEKKAMEGDECLMI